MTVELALFILPESIALAHRQTAGHWALISEAPLDGGDLDAAMAELRRAAEARGGANAPVLVVLPDEQVLYTSFTAPSDDAAMVVDRITTGLDGMTPYVVADLVYDWRAVDIDRVKVAVVAKETLGEATEFLAGHGFASAGFAATPPAERFPGMPLFGDTRADLGLDGIGLAFGSDEWVAPAADAAEEDGTATEAEAGAETTEVKAAVEAEAESEAGAKVEASAPEPEQDTPQPAVTQEPQTAGTSPEPAAKAEVEEPTPHPADATLADAAAQDDDQPAKQDTAEAAGNADEPEKPDTAATPPAKPPAPVDEPMAKDDPSKPEVDGAPKPSAETAEEDAPALTEIADLSLGRAIAPLTEDEEDDSPDAKDATDTTGQDKPEQAQDAAPASAQPQLDLSQPAPPPPRPAKPAAPTATRAKAAGPARRLSMGLPAELSTDAAADGDDIDPKTTAPTATDADTNAPAMGFSARRGKAARPETGAGDIVSTRRSRLGFGATQATEPAPTLHPDAAPTRPSGALATPKAPPAPRPPAAPRAASALATASASASALTKPAGRLVAQLARVRDASKARVQATPDGDKPQPAPIPGAAPQAAETAKAKTGKMPFGLMPKGRAAPQTPDPASEPTPETTGDTALTRGLLARKPVDQGGPSFRTGLILTLVLLVLLAMIAVWSALFLPDSPMARLFSGAADRDTASLSEPPSAAPPSVVTAPPAIGELDRGTATDAAPGAALQTPPQTTVETAAPETASVEPTTPDPAPAPRPEAVAAAVLPDIDADLDLPPLDPLPEDLLPSLEETERIYAEDGIWARPPERPDLNPLGNTTEIYLASIDPDVPAIDAIALSDPAIDPGEVLRRVPPPPPFGAALDRNALGLVTPTPEGVLTPEGAFVVLGRPPVLSQPRPREIAPDPDAAPTAGPAGSIEDAILGTFEPRPRPEDLEETRQRQVQGGFSNSELAGLRPGPRPVSAQDAAAQASLFPQNDAPAPDGAAPAIIDASDLAVAASRLPAARPGNIAALVAAAAAAERAAPAAAVAPEQTARAPSIPSNADVTRAATETNAMRLRDINLIGVTGTPSDRRALVRLPSGRFVRVGVGDRLDGGRVAAIGEGSLQYILNGRNVTLEIPG